MTAFPFHGARALVRLAVASAVTLAFSLPAAAQSGASPLKIGVIGPFTGASADFGVPMLNGIQQAFDEINAGGGYLGRKLEMVRKDDQSDPARGLKLSQELASEKVSATIGFCNTGVAAGSLEVYQSHQIPLIIPCATGTQLTAIYPAPESYIFRTSAKDAIQASFVVDDIVKRGWTKVAVFADSTAYGESGLKDVTAALARHKLAPVYVARVLIGAKDVTADLKAAREAGADAVYSYSLGPESVAIAMGRKELGWKVPQVGPWALSFPAYLEGAKDAAEDTLMPQTFIVEQRGNERRAAFLKNYTTKYHVKHVPAFIPAAQAYDSTYLLLYSLFGVKGTPDGPAIKASLENLQRIYYGAVATYDNPFSPSDKDAFTSNMLLMGQIKDGAVTYAYPADIKRNLFVQRKKP